MKRGWQYLYYTDVGDGIGQNARRALQDLRGMAFALFGEVKNFFNANVARRRKAGSSGAVRKPQPRLPDGPCADDTFERPGVANGERSFLRARNVGIANLA